MFACNYDFFDVFCNKFSARLLVLIKIKYEYYVVHKNNFYIFATCLFKFNLRYNEKHREDQGSYCCPIYCI
jgi:hypothetical protein